MDGEDDVNEDEDEEVKGEEFLSGSRTGEDSCSMRHAIRKLSPMVFWGKTPSLFSVFTGLALKRAIFRSPLANLLGVHRSKR